MSPAHAVPLNAVPGVEMGTGVLAWDARIRTELSYDTGVLTGVLTFFLLPVLRSRGRNLSFA
jgi:hypothetical protein